jgi:hypothetical protein
VLVDGIEEPGVGQLSVRQPLNRGDNLVLPVAQTQQVQMVADDI